ncbi:MAG: AAA family ATPase [Chitinophagaceae bacterium]|nr:MAG: AAA family ATPase [Chitinophagaceae bacterium]
MESNFIYPLIYKWKRFFVSTDRIGIHYKHMFPAPPLEHLPMDIQPDVLARLHRVTERHLPFICNLYRDSQNNLQAARFFATMQGRKLYRIESTRMLGKYVGETEKNMAALLNDAAERNWVLFIEEADALFGKRTTVNDAHDRYSNIETASLKQRIQNFPGVLFFNCNHKHCPEWG